MATKSYKLYKQIRGWKNGGETTDKDNKPITKLVFGESLEGKTSDYLVEDIYTPILTLILRKPYKYKVSQKPGKIPQLIISSNDRIVIHNGTISEYINKAMTSLKAMDFDIVMNAYKELRMSSEYQVKLTAKTELLLTKLNLDTGIDFSHDFIYLVIKEIIESTYFSTDGSDLKMYLRSLSFKEILALTFDCVNYKKFHIIEDDYINQLFEEKKLTFEDLNAILNKEYQYRIVVGGFSKGKTEV